MAVLYRKYRPQTFDEIVGQENVVETLKKAVSSKNEPHALLFVGPKGSGKTTTARIYAKAINCPNVQNGNPCGKCEVCEEIASGSAVDVIEIDGASNRKIDDIREIRDKISLSPSKFAKKVYIIDEVHMLTKEAFNALLKTLEEPPSHAVFVLCTTESDKLPATIVSRCQRFDFKLGKKDEIKNYLVEILKKEKVSYEDEAVAVVAGYAGGSFRDALSMTGQVAVFDNLTLELVENILGRAREDFAKKFVLALLDKDRVAALAVLEELSTKGFDSLEFIRLGLITIKDLLTIKITDTVNVSYSKDDLVNIYNGLDKCFQRLKYSPVAELPIVLLIAEIIETDGDKPKSVENKTNKELKPIEEKSKTIIKESKSVSGSNDVEIDVNARVVADEGLVKSGDQDRGLGVVGNSADLDQEGVSYEHVEVGTDLKTDGDQIQAIYNNWKAILDDIRTKNMYVTTILRGSKPIAFDGNKVTIEVYFRLHQDKLKEAKVLKLVESSISSVLGKKVFLLVNLGKKEITPTSDLSIENLVEAAGEIFGASS